jgi:hypothetical protein
MDRNPTSARQMLRIGTIMCVIWLGSVTMLVWQAQGSGFASIRPAAIGIK